jgi:hypothetical protein
MTQTTTDSSDTSALLAELTESERYDLLADERRRLLLDILKARSGTLVLDDLAERVAARENGFDADDEDSVYRLTVSLHHRDLPKLDDFGVIDYDSTATRIDL